MQAAELLAEIHRQEDPGLVAVYHAVTDEPEVRLVEVTTTVEPDREILPFRLGTEPRTVIILVHPYDWRLIKAGVLRLPPGWDRLESVWPR